MSKKAAELSKREMEKQNLVLETRSRRGEWFVVDFDQEDEEVDFLLSSSQAVSDMLSGREAKLRRSNGMESRFRFAKKVAPLPIPERKLQ